MDFVKCDKIINMRSHKEYLKAKQTKREYTRRRHTVFKIYSGVVL